VSAAPRVAISLMPLENRRDVLVSTAVAADRLGYDGYYLPETWAYDTTIILAEAALKTRAIGLGTGILGVWTAARARWRWPRPRWPRSRAAASRSGWASARRNSPRDCTTSSSSCRSPPAPHDRPGARAAARRAHPARGGHERAAAEAERPPPPEIPIYVAAIGEQSVRLTGELADGWVPFIYPRACLRQGIELLREGAVRGGHPDRLPRVCPSVPAVVAPDAATAREGAAWFVAFYLVNMGTLYRQSLVRQGFGKEVEAVLAANAPKLPAWCRGRGTLLEELIVFGNGRPKRARAWPRWHGRRAPRCPVCCCAPDDARRARLHADRATAMRRSRWTRT